MHLRQYISFLILIVLLLATSIFPLRPDPAVAQRKVSPDDRNACGGEFAAVADASLSEAAPGTNFGLDERLTVSNEGQNWHTLLAFNLSALPDETTIHQATLLLDGAETGYQRTDAFRVYNVTEPWGETTVTWNTSPDFRLNRLYANNHFISGTVHIDVTPFLQTWRSDRTGTYRLLLLPRAENMDINFLSRDHQERNGNGPRLLIRCAVNEAPPLADSEPRDAAQLEGLNRLRQNSQTPVDVRMNRGALKSALFELPIAAANERTSLENARWFLSEYEDLLRLSDAEQNFQFTRLSPDRQMVFFRQRHNGIPVYGAEVSLFISQAQVRYFGGNYVPAIRTDAQPRIGKEAAETIAGQLVGSEAVVVGDTQLYYLNPGLLGMDDSRTYLTWLVNIEQNGHPLGMFIDADTGLLRYQQTREADGFDLELRDAHGLPESIGCFALFFEETPLWGTEYGVFPYVSDPEAFDAFTHIQAVHGHWWQHYGYDSYDGDGGQLYMFLNVGMENAISSGGGCMRFGDNWATRDIIGHEFAHEVDQENANLEYIHASGALAESFADIFGHFVDPNDWLIGEGTTGNTCSGYPSGTKRDMADPPGCNDPDKMSNWVLTPKDNLGVHTNSGIHNKTAYLLTDGDGFNGYLIEGIGLAKARWLYYFLLTQGVVSTSDFHHAATLALLYSNQWAKTGFMGFTASDVCQVRNAYAATEILPHGDVNCDGQPDEDDLDADGDGESNSEDNCPYVSNFGQQDTDKDGMGDACDGDDDGDSLADGEDNCPLTPNAFQEDWDEDGIGDVCDDSDGDGVMDSADNCRTVENHEQANIDHDSYGDACDVDKDGDGVVDFPFAQPGDNCTDIENPDQADGDLDKIGDACDLCPAFPSSNNKDNDGDGQGDPCDPNDDNDKWPDSFDNCDFTPNDDQVDIDRDNIGYACDPDEQQVQESVILQNVFIPEQNPLPLDVPICPACGGVDLPLNHPVSIQTTLSAPVYVRVLNSQGHTMAQRVGEANELLELNFEAAPFSRLVRSGEHVQFAERELAPDEVRYTLQLFPLADPGGDRHYDLSIAINQGHEIYLPLTVR